MNRASSEARKTAACAMSQAVWQTERRAKRCAHAPAQLGPDRRASTASVASRARREERSAVRAAILLTHGTRLFYELLSCGEPFRRMGRGGWPAMRSCHQEMASLWAARRIFLSRSKPTRKID